MSRGPATEMRRSEVACTNRSRQTGDSQAASGMIVWNCVNGSSAAPAISHNHENLTVEGGCVFMTFASRKRFDNCLPKCTCVAVASEASWNCGLLDDAARRTFSVELEPGDMQATDLSGGDRGRPAAGMFPLLRRCRSTRPLGVQFRADCLKIIAESSTRILCA